MKKITLLILSAIFIIGLSNCTKDNNEPEDTPPAPEKILIGESYAIGSGLKVSFEADEALFVGYNKIYFTITDSVSGEIINNDLSIGFIPMMDMGMMMHSCPTEMVEWNSSTNKFEAATVFVMPSTAGVWDMTVTIENNSNGKYGGTVFEFEVVQPEETKLVSFISALDPDATYFISLIEPKNPKVGENDFEVIINRRASMMDWPYEPYLFVEIDPQMPAMNHGSPNNVNPTHIGEGHYKGVANFTMTGWWRVNMLIKDGEGNELNSESYFDITFQ